jgi:hypothetical protein
LSVVKTVSEAGAASISSLVGLWSKGEGAGGAVIRQVDSGFLGAVGGVEIAGEVEDVGDAASAAGSIVCASAASHSAEPSVNARWDIRAR